MQNIQGPFRLYCRDGGARDGHHREAATIAGLIRDWSVPLGGIGEIRFIQKHPIDWAGYTTPDYTTQTFDWLIRDSAGLIVPLWFIREELARADLEDCGSPKGYWTRRWRRAIPRDEISTDWSVFRNLKGIGWKHRTGSYYRYPRHAQERREQERTYWELREYTARVPSRVRRHLVSAYDDIYPVARRNRNWKQFRRTRYHRGTD